MYWPSISLHFGKSMCSHGGCKECDLMHFKVRQNIHRAQHLWQPTAAISVCLCALTTGGHSLNGSSTAWLRSGPGISHDRTRSRSAVCIIGVGAGVDFLRGARAGVSFLIGGCFVYYWLLLLQMFFYKVCYNITLKCAILLHRNSKNFNTTWM